MTTDIAKNIAEFSEKFAMSTRGYNREFDEERRDYMMGLIVNIENLIDSIDRNTEATDENTDNDINIHARIEE